MDTGNAKALREALVMARYNILPLPPHWEKTSCQCKECSDRREAFRIVDEALAVPPRNCDIGTAEEQKERFKLFCRATKSCPECQVYHEQLIGGQVVGTKEDCILLWAQMPYEPQKSDNSKEFKYKIGDCIRYYGRVVDDDVRTGCWKGSGIKWGKIVKLHPENRRCYEVCPDCSNFGTDRVSERAVIRIMQQF